MKEIKGRIIVELLFGKVFQVIIPKDLGIEVEVRDFDDYLEAHFPDKADYMKEEDTDSYYINKLYY